MNNSLAVSIVVESYNHSEGTELELLKMTLKAATNLISKYGKGEVLLTDTGGSTLVSELLATHFPQVTRVDAFGLSYDEAKALAAAQASGEYVLYIDGDCLPAENWLEAHLSVLEMDQIDATGGFTRYEKGFLASILTIMDFGFLFPREKRVLQCYASNNSGFRRDVLVKVPAPEGAMRCRCYAHAQLLLKNNYPVMMVPDAINVHALPSFWDERLRRGRDLVAACWINPELLETKWLSLSIFAAPLFYASNVWLDWRRMLQGYRDLDLNLVQMVLSLPLFPVLRLVDLVGIISALVRKDQDYDLAPTHNCQIADS